VDSTNAAMMVLTLPFRVANSKWSIGQCAVSE
jgi:hypothetical protein